MPLLRPAFARTLRPGFSLVPFADRVIFAMRRSSTRITSNRRAISVDAFSAQSLRRSVSLALSRPTHLFRPYQARDVQQVPGRQSRGDYDAPVDSDDLPVSRCRHRCRDRREDKVPAPGAIKGDTVGRYARRYGAGPAKSDPPRLGDTHFSDVAGQATDVAGLDGDDPESLVPAGLSPGRPSGRVSWVEERGHCLSEIPQGLLLHHLGAFRQPVVLGAGSGELTTLLQVARGGRTAGTPVGVLLDSEIPYVSGVGAVIPQDCLLGRRRGQPVSRHANTVSTDSDIPREVTRRCLSGLKVRVSIP
jgi:hypothetical protein